MLKSNDFDNIIKNLNPTEMTIALLKFGYINDKCYSDEEICEFLNIDKKLVQEVTYKCLKEKKNDFIKYVDFAIENILSNPTKIFKM